MGEWPLVRQPIAQPHYCAVRCFDEAMDPPVYVRPIWDTTG